MNIIAQRPGQLMVRFDDTPKDYAHIYDLKRKRLFLEMLVASIAARGYWEDFTGNQDDFADEINAAKSAYDAAKRPS